MGNALLFVTKFITLMHDETMQFLPHSNQTVKALRNEEMYTFGFTNFENNSPSSSLLNATNPRNMSEYLANTLKELTSALWRYIGTHCLDYIILDETLAQDTSTRTIRKLLQGIRVFIHLSLKRWPQGKTNTDAKTFKWPTSS